MNINNNQIIKELISSNKTFFIGRIAGVELQTAYDLYNNNVIDLEDDIKILENNAGIFTKNIESVKKYVNSLINSYDSCSLIADWEITGEVFSFTGKGQQLILNRTPNIPKINARYLEPYYFEDIESWMPELSGKNILIIHPFINTFQRQIENLDKIFPNRNWFKNCKLQFIKPPMTLANNHKGIDWEEHYNIFLDELKDLQQNQNFDIALVACGGYGMLVSEFIFKNLQRSVIYIGGALQLFFGVLGKRWFTNQEILNLTNDYWIRPDKSDKPENFTKVEKGCYW